VVSRRRVVFRAEARAEVREARAWYAGRAPGLGREFGRAVAAAVEEIRGNPELYPFVEEDIRRAILWRFPYQVLYYVEGEDVVVLACFHHRRDPDEWRSRR
jgi:toxin ParE1/3/4